MASLDLTFQIPEDISFEQAIALTEEILALADAADDAVLAKAITGLLQTANGARGFFVTFLTGDSPLADAPTPAVLTALRSAPALVADLMTKNLAMSTAMQLTHQANGDRTAAAGSAQVKARTTQLIQHLQLPELQAKLQQLLDSTTHNGGEYQDFLARWGYDAQQRQAIQQAITAVLSTTANS